MLLSLFRLLCTDKLVVAVINFAFEHTLEVVYVFFLFYFFAKIGVVHSNEVQDVLINYSVQKFCTIIMVHICTN